LNSAAVRVAAVSDGDVGGIKARFSVQSRVNCIDLDHREYVAEAKRDKRSREQGTQAERELTVVKEHAVDLRHADIAPTLCESIDLPGSSGLAHSVAPATQPEIQISPKLTGDRLRSVQDPNKKSNAVREIPTALPNGRFGPQKAGPNQGVRATYGVHR
jgi:hypothetical protein